MSSKLGFEQGFAIIKNLFPASACQDLVGHVDSLAIESAGSRCLLDHGWCRELAVELRNRVAAKLDFVRDCVVVQCTYFRKAEDKNWMVAWHQDRSIPVQAQVQAKELSGWSVKEGTTFVQPPDAVLATMFAVRLHLDDSTSSNGPLRVIAGSHRNGTLSADQIADLRRTKGEQACLVPTGGVLVFRPLLLHASSKSVSSEPRRVLHFLFGPPELPHGLVWRRTV